MNLFKSSMRPSYYLKHPWQFFRQLFYSFKYAWQRATKGYSFYDSMDMDNFLLNVIPGMLRDIAEGAAYPGVKPFDTYEKWQDYCNSLADVFESLQEENWRSEGRNEWQDKFDEAFEVQHSNITTSSMTKEEANEICKKYFEREVELVGERNELLKNAYSELSQYHDMFWI